MASVEHMRSTIAALWTGNLFAPFLIQRAVKPLPLGGGYKARWIMINNEICILTGRFS